MSPPAAREKARKERRGRSPDLVGTTVAGRYHLVRRLGDGGMGSVYKAADRVLRRFVAVKLLHPRTAENPSAVERFVREARSSAAIGHPNIIDILDFGLEGDRHFLVMEYLRGRSLSEALVEEGRLSIARACSIATHTLAGLAAAHDRGILHRDLKPANLMLIALLGDRDFVKVCDFGFAALVKPTVRIDEGKSLTPARTLVGTPAYAAPERLRGDESRDPRMDLYSLGVVLYEMLAGRRPFDAPTFRELALRVRNDPAPPLRLHRPDIPPALEAVVARALSKSRDHRHGSAQELAAALVPFGGRSLVAEEDLEDSFTMDLLRIRARETAQQRAMSEEEAEQILALRRRARREREGRGRPVVAPEPVAAADSPPRASAPPTARRVPGTRGVLGSVPLSVLRFVAQRYGERALRSVLQSLRGPTARVFASGVGAEDEVPYEALNALVAAVDRALGADDLHLVVQCGKAGAEGAFERMQVPGAPGSAPERLLRAMPGVLAELVRGVSLRTLTLGRGHARVELDERGESSLTFCVFLIGFLDRSLERFGARDIEVSMITSRALGDDDCVFEISWI